MNETPASFTVHRPVRFTAKQFLRMNAEGLFDRYAKTELIDGEVLGMNAQHRRHSRIKNELVERIRLVLRGGSSGLTGFSEVSVALSPESMPEPDIVILVDDGGDGPVPVDSVRLVVEIADTTIDFDLRRKAMLYADAGVPEYWVVDVANRSIHRMHRPNEGSYAEKMIVPFGTMIDATTIAGLTIDTTGL